jgi:hypothetical protein
MGSAERKMRNAYKILVMKPEEKRQIGRQGHGWESNTKMDLIVK